MTTARPTVRHPAIWTVLYLPFGAMSGFVNVALTYLATRHGLSITEASFLPASAMVSQWLKWIWAPFVDVTLSPKKWYLIGTAASAFGVFALAAMPMTEDTLPALLGVIASTSLLRSFVGMSLEAMLAGSTPAEGRGRASAWFQIGNLGGAALGGGLGLTLLDTLAEPWMAGAILATIFLACALFLFAVPAIAAHERTGQSRIRGLLRDIANLARSKGGILVTLVCFLPLGTGAAQAVLAQAKVADHWQATAQQVEWVQGYAGAAVTALGCFAGGWMSARMSPRPAYVVQVLLLAGAAAAFALTPATPTWYVVWSLGYAFMYGAVFAGWTVVILAAMGARSAATKYSLFASLSNFPTWWLGLVLGYIADRRGPIAMVLAEAGIGVVAVAVFVGASRLIRRTRLPDELVES